MNYHNKYLKYKNKYLKLKKQLGGSNYDEIIQKLRDKGNYDEWVEIGSRFGTPSPTGSVIYYDMNGDYIRVKNVKKEYEEGDVAVFDFKNSIVSESDRNTIPNLNEFEFIQKKPSSFEANDKHMPPLLIIKRFTSKFNTDWENYPTKFVKIYSNDKGVIHLNYIVNISVTSDNDKYKIDLNLPKLLEYEVFKADSFCEKYGLFLGYESIENTGYKLDDNILIFLKIGNTITVIKNILELGINYHKPIIVATGRVNNIKIENGKIISIQINDTVFKTPSDSEIGDYVIFNGEFRLDDTEFKGPILERKISVKRVIPSFNIDIEYGRTIYKLSVNNEMTVKQVHWSINRLIINDPTKNKPGFKLDINLITKLMGEYKIMDEERTLSDYGFHEGSKIIVTPKGGAGL